MSTSTAAAVIVHGHYGRPVLAFPSERGSAHDFEGNGMVAAVGGLIEAGRVKLYCVDSNDGGIVVQRLDLARGPRAHPRRLRGLDPRPRRPVHPRRPGRRTPEIVTTGCSMGAFHAANFALKRADRFPLALCFSGNYDPAAWGGWGERGEADVLQQPERLRRAPRRRAPRLAALAHQPAARLRPGPVGGHHGLAGEHPPAGRRAGRPRGSGMSWTCGGTTCPTTGRPGARSSRTIYRGSADDDRHDHT